MRFGHLSLRSLIWVLFAIALVIAWRLERTQLRKEIAEALRIHELLGYFDSRLRTRKLKEYHADSSEQLADLVASDSNYGISSLDAATALMVLLDRGAIAEIERCCTPRIRRLSEDVERVDLISLEQATALCRARGQPDPLRIRTELEGAGSPTTLLNVMIDKTALDFASDIWIHEVSDTGHFQNWRVEFTNEEGVRTPISDQRHYLVSGVTVLNSFGLDQSFQLQLDARKYVSPPLSGRYRVQLIYSTECISDQPDLSGLIVWKSQPITVDVIGEPPLNFRFEIARLLVIVGLGIALLGAESRFRGPNRVGIAKGSGYVTPLCLLLMIVLAGSWTFDVCKLKTALNDARPDSQATWTMVESEP